MKSVTPWIAIAACLILAFSITAVVYLNSKPINAFASVPPVEAINQSTPISLEEARHQLTVALPEGASNIQFSAYSEFIAYEFLLKFQAPLDVCKSHAVLLLEKGDNLVSTSVSPNAITVSSPLKPTWFDIHKINNGFVSNKGGIHQPKVWIDTDREMFYYMLTD